MTPVGDKVTCRGCGATYKRGAPHYMFCGAKTCERCDATFGEVISPGEDGKRLCPECRDDVEAQAQ